MKFKASSFLKQKKLQASHTNNPNAKKYKETTRK